LINIHDDTNDDNNNNNIVGPKTIVNEECVGGVCLSMYPQDG